MLKLRMVAGKQAAAGNVLNPVVTRGSKEVDRIQVSFKDTDTIGDVKLRLRLEHGLSWGRQPRTGGSSSSGTSGVSGGGVEDYAELQKEYQRVLQEMDKMKTELSRASSQSDATTSGQMCQELPPSLNAREDAPGLDQAPASAQVLQKSVSATTVLDNRGLPKMEFAPGWKPIFAMGTTGGFLSEGVAVGRAGMEVGLGSAVSSPLTPLEFAARASPESQGLAESNGRAVLHTAPECRELQLFGGQEIRRPGTAPGLLSCPPTQMEESIGDSILKRYLLEARISDLD